MAIAKKLKKYLDSEHIPYEVLHHREAYTAQEIAGAQHVSGKQMAKCVVVNVDGKNILCVLPADHRIDFKKFKKTMKAQNAALVTEEEVARLFPDYEIGAEPPLKALCGLPICMDKCLQDNPQIVFNAGTHTDMIKMSVTDYMNISKPDKVADFGC